MERRKKDQKIVLIMFVISLLLSICLCVSALWGMPVFGVMDVPGFVHVEDGYLVDGGYCLYEVDENTDAVVFITTTPVDMGGAECLAESLKDGEDLTTPRGFHIRTDGERVIVNQDNPLAVGESVHLEAKRSGFNPFWNYTGYLNLTNEGTVQGKIDSDGQRTEYDRQVLVAIGSSGDQALPNPITAVVLLFSLCAVLITGAYLAFNLITQLIRRISTKGDEQL